MPPAGAALTSLPTATDTLAFAEARPARISARYAHTCPSLNVYSSLFYFSPACEPLSAHCRTTPHQMRTHAPTSRCPSQATRPLPPPRPCRPPPAPPTTSAERREGCPTRRGERSSRWAQRRSVRRRRPGPRRCGRRRVDSLGYRMLPGSFVTCAFATAAPGLKQKLVRNGGQLRFHCFCAPAQQHARAELTDLVSCAFSHDSRPLSTQQYTQHRSSRAAGPSPAWPRG